MSRFRTIHISNPEYESNGLRYITVKSNHLAGRGDISVFVPLGGNYHQLPIVLLLHGVYGSHWSWSHNAGIHLKMDTWIATNKLPPMVLAMPSDGLWGDGSGYLPHASVNFEKWIAEDVIDAILETIPEVGNQSPLFIAGLSMGGFGALRIGASYGNKFKGASALSAITHLDQMPLFIEEDISGFRQKKRADESVFETLMFHRTTLPKFRFDCGLSDNLLSENRKFHEQLLSASVPHIYEEFSGGHDWAYWEENILKSLLFFNQIISY